MNTTLVVVAGLVALTLLNLVSNFPMESIEFVVTMFTSMRTDPLLSFIITAVCTFGAQVCVLVNKRDDNEGENILLLLGAGILAFVGSLFLAGLLAQLQAPFGLVWAILAILLPTIVTNVMLGRKAKKQAGVSPYLRGT